MLLRFIMGNGAGAFVELPKPNRRGEDFEIARRRIEVVVVEVIVADTHVVEVADPSEAVGYETQHQRRGVDAQAVRPRLGIHFVTVGIHPYLVVCGIPDTGDMVPLAIREVGATPHIIKDATADDAEGGLPAVQLQLVAAGHLSVNVAEIQIANGVGPNPCLKREASLRVQG